LLTGTGTQRWRLACKLTLPVILLGFTLTRGRGGWVAAVAGFIYLGYKRGFLKVRTLTGIATVIMASSILYFVNTEFQEQVDRTLWPDKQYLQKNSFGIGGIDDGGRIITFEHEVGSFIKKPLLGAGFHHRGGLSGLTPSGSHNFWLQILLETGIVGFYLLILICFRMWKHSDVSAAKQQRLSLPLKSALFTTFIAGLGGEYFYGGIGLFTVFLIYASTGSLPRMNSQKNSIEKIKAA